MSNWPYTLRTKQWLDRRSAQLRDYPFCFDCAEAGRPEVPAVEVIAVGSALVSCCAKHVMVRGRPGKG